MLQNYSKALSQLKAGNTSENLLNEVRRIIYSFKYEYQNMNNILVATFIQFKLLVSASQDKKFSSMYFI